jgi:hypothetical protein
MRIFIVFGGKNEFFYRLKKNRESGAKSISSGGLHMHLYSKIWRFAAKIHLQQGL